MDALVSTDTLATETPLPGDRARRIRGWVLRGMLGVLALMAIPVLFLGLSGERLNLYTEFFLDTPFLAVLLFALVYRVRKASSGSEGWFWGLLAVAYGCWVASWGISLYEFLMPARNQAVLAENMPYLIFYAALATALEFKPEGVRQPRSALLLILDKAGSFVLLMGVTTYFILIPGYTNYDPETFGLSFYALFIAFDIYLVLRIRYLRSCSPNTQWRSIYGWLLVSVALSSSGDVLWLLFNEGVLATAGFWKLSYLVWPLSFCALTTAALTDTSQPSKDANPEDQPTATGLLVVYAMLPVLSHMILYRFGYPDMEAEAFREILLLGMASLLAVMCLAYERILRSENIRLSDIEIKTRAELAKLAYHDELTGLPNRNLFHERLQRAVVDHRRHGHGFSVIFCDLDQFKIINDSLGHDAGDQVLITAADRLKASLREIDTVARLGGDEFAILVSDTNCSTDLAHLAEKLLHAIAQPMAVGQRQHVLTGSMGIAVYPHDTTDQETLLRHADTAMYQAKLHGRNTFRMFTDSMNEAAQERLVIEQGLRAGLMEDQFCVFYQPIVDTVSGETRGFEALLRWVHPERGYISPVSFIDVAEKTGLIVPIGNWVLRKACTWAAQLQTGGRAPLPVAVNVSPRQLREPGWTDNVRQALQDTGLDPALLCLEITESMALSISSTVSALEELRALGVRVALDDFGTGYAALNRLQELPLDIVKIDRSFITGTRPGSVNATIVNSVVNMAHALSIYIVAEGVETEEDLELVRSSGCNAIQGYYFCKPCPGEVLEDTWPDLARPLEVSLAQ